MSHRISSRAIVALPSGKVNGRTSARSNLAPVMTAGQIGEQSVRARLEVQPEKPGSPSCHAKSAGKQSTPTQKLPVP